MIGRYLIAQMGKKLCASGSILDGNSLGPRTAGPLDLTQPCDRADQRSAVPKSRCRDALINQSQQLGTFDFEFGADHLAGDF